MTNHLPLPPPPPPAPEGEGIPASLPVLEVIPAGCYWLTFSGSHDIRHAWQRYQDRYGKPPESAFRDRYGMLRLGPCPE